MPLTLKLYLFYHYYPVTIINNAVHNSCAQLMVGEMNRSFDSQLHLRINKWDFTSANCASHRNFNQIMSTTRQLTYLSGSDVTTQMMSVVGHKVIW